MPLRVYLAALGGDFDAALARKILPGEAGGIGSHFCGLALRHQPPATLAGGGADIYQIIGAADRILIMFHDQHSIAEVTQPPQRDKQPFIVALMQPDGRFIQHIKHARQARTDLRGEPNALRFPAGERGGRPRERKIIQPHIHQELQAIIDFTQDSPRNIAPLGREGFLNLREPIPRPVNGHGGSFTDMKPRHLHRE